MEWTLLIGAGIVVLAIVFAVLRVRQLNQPHTARSAGGRPTGGSPQYYTRGSESGGGSERAEGIRAAKRRIDDLQGDGPVVPIQQRVTLTADMLPDRTRRKAERLLKQDRAASAINTIREDTGAGLNEARRIVTEMRDGDRPEASLDDSGTSDPAPEGGFAQHARALKAQGRTEAAVALVVRETGMSDAEAAAFVAALDTR